MDEFMSNEILTDESFKLRLYAVIVHRGKNRESGHYVVYIYW